MGKYIRRALKYYVFLLVLITLVVIFLALVGYADLTNIHTLFRNGFNAVWEIALIFLAIAFIYPKLGFGNRDFTLRAKTWDEARTNMMIAMGDRGYKLESEDGDTFTFRKKWFLNKLAKFLEDRITVVKIGEEETDSQLNRYSVNIEGLTKDVLRIVSALYRVQNQNKDE